MARTTFNIPDMLRKRIKELADLDDHDETAIFRRSLELELLISDFEMKGAKLLLQMPDGSITEVLRTRTVLLPK